MRHADLIAAQMESIIPNVQIRSPFGEDWMTNFYKAATTLSIDRNDAESIFFSDSYPFIETVIKDFFDLDISSEIDYAFFKRCTDINIMSSFSSSQQEITSELYVGMEPGDYWWTIPNGIEKLKKHAQMLLLLIETIKPFENQNIELHYRYESEPPLSFNLHGFVVSILLSLKDILAETYIILEEFDKADILCCEIYDDQKNWSEGWESKTIAMRKEIEEKITPDEDYNKIKNNFPGAFDDWQGYSPAIVKVMKNVIVNYNNDPIFILGETGTGKELVSQSISKLTKSDIHSFNCASVSGNTAYSLLFGHEKGAFTGAYKQHKGLFEQANDGIVFLDEIHHLDSKCQAMLLRFLEEKKIRRLGSDTDIGVEVKIIVASNLDKEKLLAAVQHDLLYRLKVDNAICVPPLKDRDFDRILLSLHYLPGYKKYSATNTNNKISFTPTALMMYGSFLFNSGNVRELISGIEKLYASVNEHHLFGNKVGYTVTPDIIVENFKDKLDEDGVTLENTPSAQSIYMAYCLSQREKSVGGYLYFSGYDVKGASVKFSKPENTIRNNHPSGALREKKEKYPFYICDHS